LSQMRSATSMQSSPGSAPGFLEPVFPSPAG